MSLEAIERLSIPHPDSATAWLISVGPILDRQMQEEPMGSGNREAANVAGSEGLKPNAPHPTPRTDAAKFTIAEAIEEQLRPEREVVDAYFARQLERELNAALRGQVVEGPSSHGQPAVAAPHT